MVFDLIILLSKRPIINEKSWNIVYNYYP
jgi:hypothetical protein